MPISPLEALRQRNAAKGLPAKVTGKQKLAGTVGGAAVAGALIALVAQWEGLRTDPYQDIIGKWTVCYGETNVQMRRYTEAECADMLANSLDEYARPVLARNPELRDRPNQLIAATSLSYNIGNANYRRSSVARFFSMGRWREGCNAILLWDRAGGRVVKGLVNRRKAEWRVCTTGLP